MSSGIRSPLDSALLGLLLGGVGDDEAGRGGLLGLVRADDDSVVKGLQTHGFGPPVARISSRGLRVPTIARSAGFGNRQGRVPEKMPARRPVGSAPPPDGRLRG